MLVLSRSLHDKILIGNDIEVTVVSIKGQVVRLGISAPVKFPFFAMSWTTHKERKLRNHGNCNPRKED